MKNVSKLKTKIIRERSSEERIQLLEIGIMMCDETTFDKDEIWKVSLLHKLILTCIHSKFFITYAYAAPQSTMSLFQIVEIYYISKRRFY